MFARATALAFARFRPIIIAATMMPCEQTAIDNDKKRVDFLCNMLYNV